MAKKHPTGMVEVRALCDLPEFGVRAGEVVAIAVERIAAMCEIGVIDDTPEAVDYAKSER